MRAKCGTGPLVYGDYFVQNILLDGWKYGGYSIYLYNLGKLAKRGGGGYPQALPKVINLQGMLEFPEILALIEKLPPRSYT